MSVSLTLDGLQDLLLTTGRMTQCQVCHQRYTNPRFLPCQHVFCMQCLKRHAQNQALNRDTEGNVSTPGDALNRDTGANVSSQGDTQNLTLNRDTDGNSPTLGFALNRDSEGNVSVPGDALNHDTEGNNSIPGDAQTQISNRDTDGNGSTLTMFYCPNENCKKGVLLPPQGIEGLPTSEGIMELVTILDKIQPVADSTENVQTTDNTENVQTTDNTENVQTTDNTEEIQAITESEKNVPVFTDNKEGVQVIADTKEGLEAIMESSSLEIEKETSKEGPTPSSVPEDDKSSDLLNNNVAKRAEVVGQFTLPWFPGGATCTQHGNIVTCESGGKAANIYRPEGRVITRLQTTRGHSWMEEQTNGDQTIAAWDLTCNQREIYVSDMTSGSVLQFTRTGQCAKSIHVGFKGCAGLCLTKSTMYVTSAGEDKVYTINIDSSPQEVRTFISNDQNDRRFDMRGPRFVDATADRVAVSCWNSRQVQMFTNDGSLVYTYNDPESNQANNQHQGDSGAPWGLAIDRKQRLLVAYSWNYSVCILSDDGKLLTTIDLTLESIGRPRGLALKPSGELVITAAWPHSVVMFDYETLFTPEGSIAVLLDDHMPSQISNC